MKPHVLATSNDTQKNAKRLIGPNRTTAICQIRANGQEHLSFWGSMRKGGYFVQNTFLKNAPKLRTCVRTVGMSPTIKISGSYIEGWKKLY